uniref:Serpentine Receptor, class E (Epsilon) n=1 Tax=Panagrellus redivivus TaxID=6233 RepID=A0A7E4VSX9_PANRE
MQLPAIFERICATVFYKTYLNWKCYETLFSVFIAWVLVINICYDVIPMPITIGYAIIGVANFVIIPLYILLFRVNFNRYKNKSQNLAERYQVFQNVESLYPLAWTVVVEVIHNMETLAGAFVYGFFVQPSGSNVNEVLLNSIFNLVREWVLVINICYDVIPMPISFAYVVIGIANVIIVPLYIILFWINFNRYKNKSQSLTERYQVFQNVESLYPLAWTVAVEVVHNIYTVAAVLVVNIVVKPSNNASYYVCMDSVSYLTREIILLAYCIPFLVYSKERRKAQFINKVNAENQNVNMLYFKQLKEQW